MVCRPSRFWYDLAASSLSATLTQRNGSMPNSATISQDRSNVAWTRPIVLVLFFASGATGLVYEIIWVRQLTLVFGVTVFAVSAVLGAFMGGLALGSVAFGRLADARPERALAVYGIIELGIAAYALCLPALIEGVTPLYAWLRSEVGAQFWGLSVFKLVAMFVVLLPATVLMGGTYPVMVRHVVREERATGRGVGLLYGVNTIGAVVGCFLASFVLIGAVGVRHTLHIAVAVNAVVGGCALVLGRRASPDEEARVSDEAPAVEEEPLDDRVRRLLLWGFGLSGFCALGYEALWTRMLKHVVGNDVHAFGIMLTTFLAGLSLGSLIVSPFKMSRRRAVLALATAEVLIGCFALLSIPGFAALPSLSERLGASLGRDSWRAEQTIELAQCALVMIVPAMLMGATFPVAGRAFAHGLSTLGRKIGGLYAANTCGAVAGSFMAGFVLVPWIGVQKSVFLLALVNGAIGLVLSVALRTELRKLRTRLAAGALVLAMVGCVVAGLRPIGRPLIFSVRSERDFDVLHYREGISSSVAVLRSRLNPTQRELNINGDPVSFTNYDDFKIQKLLAHLPLLAHPDPQSMLLVGFGSGNTSYSGTLHDAQVTCVELESGERATAELFKDLNHNILSNPNFRLRIDDGRNWLLTVRESYDVISRDTLRIKTSQNLFTREFYELCERRLTDGGFACGMIPVDMCPTESYFKKVVRTFQTVFRHVSLWYANPQILLLLGSREELDIDFESFRRRLASSDIARDLAAVDLDDPYVFLSYFLMADDHLSHYVGEPGICTDDRPLGFSTKRQVLPQPAAMELTENLLRHQQDPFPFLSNVETQDARSRLTRAQRAAVHVIRGRQYQALRRWQEAADEYLRATAILPEDRNGRRGRSQVYDKLAQLSYGRGRVQHAIGLLLQAIDLDPTALQPLLGLATCYEATGQLREALATYERALKLAPDLPLSIQELKTKIGG